MTSFNEKLRTKVNLERRGISLTTLEFELTNSVSVFFKCGEVSYVVYSTATFRYGPELSTRLSYTWLSRGYLLKIGNFISYKVAL